MVSLVKQLTAALKKPFRPREFRDRYSEPRRHGLKGSTAQSSPQPEQECNDLGRKSTSLASSANSFTLPESAMEHISTNMTVPGNGAGPSSARCRDDCPFPCPYTSQPRGVSDEPKAEACQEKEPKDSGVNFSGSHLEYGEIVAAGSSQASDAESQSHPPQQQPQAPMIITRLPQHGSNQSPFSSKKQPVLEDITVPVSASGEMDLVSFFDQIKNDTNTARITYIDRLFAKVQSEDSRRLGKNRLGQFGAHYIKRPDDMPERKRSPKAMSREKDGMAEEFTSEAKAEGTMRLFKWPFELRKRRHTGGLFGIQSEMTTRWRKETVERQKAEYEAKLFRPKSQPDSAEELAVGPKGELQPGDVGCCSCCVSEPVPEAERTSAED